MYLVVRTSLLLFLISDTVVHIDYSTRPEATIMLKLRDCWGQQDFIAQSWEVLCMTFERDC